MKYKAVLFDLDGTLLDYKAAQLEAVDHSISLFDLVNSPEVQNYESRGDPSPDSQKMKEAFLKAEIHEDPSIFLSRYFNRLSTHGMVIKGAKELLASLYKKVKLAVVSNGPGEVQNPRLDTAGLSHFFTKKFYSRDLGIAKPDPAILQLAMKDLEVTAAETLFIGDSTTSDQPAAAAAGVDFFLFKSDFSDSQLQELLV